MTKKALVDIFGGWPFLLVYFNFKNLFLAENCDVDASVSTGGCPMAKAKFPQAILQEASQSHRTSLLSPDELREYCQTLFQFRQISYKRFRWISRKRLVENILNLLLKIFTRINTNITTLYYLQKIIKSSRLIMLGIGCRKETLKLIEIELMLSDVL